MRAAGLGRRKKMRMAPGRIRRWRSRRADPGWANAPYEQQETGDYNEAERTRSSQIEIKKTESRNTQPAFRSEDLRFSLLVRAATKASAGVRVSGVRPRIVQDAKRQRNAGRRVARARRPAVGEGEHLNDRFLRAGGLPRPYAGGARARRRRRGLRRRPAGYGAVDSRRRRR